jgi:hypothetical protein
VAASYCITCGTELAPDHRFCPKCGAERWTPPQEEPALRPPPVPGSQPFHREAVKPVPAPKLRWLPYVYGAGAVFWLIELAQFAAIVAAPAGRDQLHQALVAAGVNQNVWAVVIVESIIVATFEAGAATLHAAAYFGLRRMRSWGWIAAIILAAGWSLILVGIPVLVILWRRPTRQSYGIS